MPPYRAQLGGPFGSGVTPPPSRPIDLGGAIDAAVGGASSLIRTIYLRRAAEQQRQFAESQARDAARVRNEQLLLSQQQFQRQQEQDAAAAERDRRDFEFKQEQAKQEEERKNLELRLKGVSVDPTKRGGGVPIEPADHDTLSPHPIVVDGKPMYGYFNTKHGGFFDATGNRITGKITPFVTPVQPSIVVLPGEQGQPAQGVITRGPGMGTSMPLPGVVAGKGTVTEGERLAKGYSDRMEQAEATIASIGAAGHPTEVTAVAGAIPKIGPYAERKAMTATQQQYRQAQEDWVRAKLRKESGAVIAENEMAREISTYFPQPGDLPPVIEQKRVSRHTAMAAMQTAAGRLAGSPGARRDSTPPPSDRTAVTLEQQLWDAAVARYGKKRVLREYGPRPK